MSTPGSVVVKQHSREDFCYVAPHPDIRRQLLDRYREIQRTLSTSPELSILGSVLRPVERRPPGSNDGLLRPGPTFDAGTSFAAQVAGVDRKKQLRGDINMIVVMVDFPDKSFYKSQTKEHFESIWFQEGNNSVRDYYYDVSNGAVNIKGEVVGPFRMPNNIVYYANGAHGSGKAPNARTMARDAAILADPTVNFKQYDNDGDGYVDAFVIVHAGSGAESIANLNDIWSQKGVLENGAYQADGTKVYSYLTVGADCKLGVCAHESGHLLFGWPDLYDTDYSSKGIGNWCVMSYGDYNGKSLNPSTPCAWCKVDQGWVEVVTPTKTQDFNLLDVKDGHQVLKLWKDGAPESEYFLVENRQLKGRDANIPAGGLLLWHIDENKKSNTSEETNYKVALVQSDGKKDLEYKVDQGDKGDPFPGIDSVRLVSATTNPSTNANNGAATGLEISNISDPADVMTFTVSFGA